MGLFGGRAEPVAERKPGTKRAGERATRLSERELLDWLESSCGSLAHLIISYRNYGDHNAVADAVITAEGILGMLDDLQSRQLTSVQ